MQTITNSSVSVWVTSVKITDLSNNFRYWIFCNDSTNIIYLSIWTPAIVWKWIRLNSEWGSFEINFNNPIRWDIYAISTWATSNLSFVTIN